MFDKYKNLIIKGWLKKIHRIDPDTNIYCIFGHPIGHSKSPLIHNTCFKYYQVNAVYLAFEIDEIAKGIEAMRVLNFKGASVTLPFKETVMDNLDWIDQDALNIGAVNTIVNDNGILKGFNTDCTAAIAPLKPFGIRDKQICIIGAGGAAQAICYGISKEKGKLVIINRNKKRGRKLAVKYNGDFILPGDRHIKDKIAAANIDIVINTTPVGMYPDIEFSPFPFDFIHSNMMVMDIVYNPLETKFLSDAKKKGCTTIDGLSMFLYQGAEQFKLWTGIIPDMKRMRQAVIGGDH